MFVFNARIEKAVNGFVVIFNADNGDEPFQAIASSPDQVKEYLSQAVQRYLAPPNP